MNNNMINSENEMPGAEMPSGSINDGQATLADGEMPAGGMDGIPQNFGGEMPLSDTDMPRGNMNDMHDNYSGRVSSTNEMPTGSMENDTNTAFSASQNLDAPNEMPSGNMNESAAITAEQNQLKTIDIPGSWKLQLTHSS